MYVYACVHTCICAYMHMCRKIFKDLVNNEQKFEKKHYVREDWDASHVWDDHMKFMI